MAEAKTNERFFDFSARGKFGKPWEYGQKIYGQIRYGEEEHEINAKEYGYRRYGFTEYGQNDKRWGVYQRRREQDRIFYVRESFMQPENPQTVPQQAWRDIFTDGMNAWGLLTDAQKKVYHTRAQIYHLHGVNLFLREYLNSKK